MQAVWRSPLFQKFWDIAGAASVRVKVLGIVLGVILLLSFFITLQMRAALSETLKRELEDQGLAISESTAEQVSIFLADGDLNLVNLLIAERQRHYTGSDHNTLVSYIVVEDAAGRVIAHTFKGEVPPDILLQETPQKVTHTERDDGHIVEIATLLADRQGLLRLGLSEDNIWQTVNNVTWQIVTITLVMIGVGFVAAFFLTWILTRPILSLVEATQAVGKGDFSRQVPRWANDEIGDLADAFNAMTRELAQAEQERRERENLREGYIRGVIRAQEEERKRIARELHDSTSQSLTSLLVGLRTLGEAPDSETLEARLDDIRKVVSSTLDEVHTLAWQLRPSVLDDLGLTAALERYVADYQRRYQIQVDFVTRGICERPAVELEASIYRIVQEGLTNIARHSQAKSASVLIEQRKNTIRIIIEDDGIGFEPGMLKSKRPSLGLQGIRERAQLFGGSLTIESQPGKGTSLFVEIPVNGH